jgi:GT2 family glycosyltransferase
MIFFSLVNYYSALKVYDLVKVIMSFDLNARVFVCDNSVDTTEFEELSALLVDWVVTESVILTCSEKNGGYGFGHNINFKKIKLYGKGKVFVCNNDIRFEYNTIEGLTKWLDKRANDIVMVPTYLMGTDDILYSHLKMNGLVESREVIKKKKGYVLTDYCAGSFFAFAFRESDILLFEESYFMYWEEVDWCFNQKENNNKRCVSVLEYKIERVNHDYSSAVFAEYYISRNSLFFAKKYGYSQNHWIKFIFKRFLRRIFGLVLRGHFRMLKAHLKGCFHIIKFNG